MNWSIQQFFNNQVLILCQTNLSASMSSINNIPQLAYYTLSEEAQILQGKAKLDLKLYEKNTMNKINFRSFLGKNFICSCNDQYKKIRIPIVAVFIKIFANKSENNIVKLNKIKKLIYSSPLQDIVQKHGITSEQLLNNFALTINEFELGSQKNQSLFIKKINSEPFFDRIIMEAFHENFLNVGFQNNLSANISKWFKNEIGISIIFQQNQVYEERDDIIFLKKNKQHQILRQLKSFNICSMTSIIDDSKENITPQKKILNSARPGSIQTSQNLLKSISQSQSPTRRFSTRSKVNEYVAISLQSSLQVLQNKENTQTQQKTDSQKNSQPIIKRHQRNNQSVIWKILCCGKD